MTPAELDEKVCRMHWLKEMIHSINEAIINRTVTPEEAWRLQGRRDCFERELFDLRDGMPQ